MWKVILILFSLISITTESEEPSLSMALVKYSGGGDWYSNPTSLLNLASYCNTNLGTNFTVDYNTIEIGSAEIFDHAFLHLTGHGNVVFSDNDAENLRLYLVAGGFLHIDDNYGMDPFIRVAMKKVFPELEFVELPFDHPIYHQKYKFPKGLPKIHKHDDKAPQGFGLLYEGRLVCFYSYESDLGDGWEDFEVHKDPEEKRIAALRMGANIIQFAFSQG